jgi:hypothetical protein
VPEADIPEFCTCLTFKWLGREPTKMFYQPGGITAVLDVRYGLSN